MNTPLPIPSFYDPAKVGEVRQVPYQARFEEAQQWRVAHQIKPGASDAAKVALMLIDVQNTFCLPSFELPVQGAVEDCRRTAEFIYKNLANITSIHCTMDTHKTMQIFHPMYWVDEKGNHPAPATIITEDEVKSSRWRVNPGIAYSTARGNYPALQAQAMDYVSKLAAGGKYPLMIWPFHAMIGGVGHALVAGVEEAVFFHSICRSTQTGIEVKGGNPLTENYSIFRPEVTTGPGGGTLPNVQANNTRFLDLLLEHDYVLIGGQAKSHCVAWSIDDMLTHIHTKDPTLVEKAYLLEDLTSPVIIPGVIDFTQQAFDAFNRFQQAGMHVVRSVTPMAQWPDFNI